MLRNNPEECRSHLIPGGNLKSRRGSHIWLLLSYFISSRVGSVGDLTEIRIVFVDRDTALSLLTFWRRYLNMYNLAENVEEVSSNSLKNFKAS